MACFIILFLAGGIMLMQMQQESEDRRAVKAYMDTRGKAPMPKSWRGKIGDGI